MSSPSFQRKRAVDAMVESIARQGYAATTVGHVTAASRLSRTTFYEHFKDREDCFLDAQGTLAVALRAEVERAVERCEPARALAGAIEALIAFATNRPWEFHLIAHEATIAGPRALQARDEMMLTLERTVEAASADCPDGDGERADIPTRLVLGGVVRLLGVSMRRTGGGPEAALACLPGWLDCYTLPGAPNRWRELRGVGSVAVSANGPARPIAPQPLPRGRHRLSEETVDVVQRERILHANAEVVCAKGYAAVTVADIARAAGVSREIFYRHFKDKQDAFLQTRQLVFEQMIAASAGAFFTSEKTWPEGIWEAMRRTTAWVLDQPVLAHFDFIEVYALGPVDAKQVDEHVLAFNVFLEEGYRYRPEAAELPRLYAQAIAGSVFELVAFYISHDRVAELPGLLPLTTYVILAPFTGAREACELIDGFISASEQASAAAGGNGAFGTSSADRV